jgi:hypothetical protein
VAPDAAYEAGLRQPYDRASRLRGKAEARLGAVLAAITKDRGQAVAECIARHPSLVSSEFYLDPADDLMTWSFGDDLRAFHPVGQPFMGFQLSAGTLLDIAKAHQRAQSMKVLRELETRLRHQNAIDQSVSEAQNGMSVPLNRCRHPPPHPPRANILWLQVQRDLCW